MPRLAKHGTIACLDVVIDLDRNFHIACQKLAVAKRDAMIDLDDGVSRCPEVLSACFLQGGLFRAHGQFGIAVKESSKTLENLMTIHLACCTATSVLQKTPTDRDH